MDPHFQKAEEMLSRVLTSQHDLLKGSSFHEESGANVARFCMGFIRHYAEELRNIEAAYPSK